MKINIEVEVPKAKDILNSGCPVPIARKGQTWRKSCLGKIHKERGVYVIHHDGKIKYVGKTDGPTMSFGRRLRREFREQSSQNKHNYPKLCVLRVPPDIKVCFYTTDQIKTRIKFNGKAPRIDHMVAMFEVALIVHLDPDFQQQLVDAYAKQIDRHGKVQDMISKLQKSLPHQW